MNANASRFNPAALGDYPQADINANINAAGVLSPAWKVNADFALRPSRLFDQPLSGRGKLAADDKHVSGVDATLSLGQNSVDLRGAFGAPGEKLTGASTAASSPRCGATCMAPWLPAASSRAAWRRRAPASSSMPTAWAGSRPSARPTTATCT